MKSHFKGSSVLEHLKEARLKGHAASKESHGIEAQGHLIGGADAARELSMISLLIFIATIHLSMPHKLSYITLIIVLSGLFFWKVGRSALLGWARLEKINKLINDEKDEIENNREEEKAELTEMYQAKGFSEPLLSKVIDVLMADDNKLLGIMLEEELGVTLETYEHPLKQALGTAIGYLLSSALLFISILLFPLHGPLIACPITIFIASALMAKIEQIRPLNYVVWNLSITSLAAGATYFVTELIK